MTKAVCIYCGENKLGALVPCVACKTAPDTKIDRAKSILLSDHCLSVSELNFRAVRIRNGESLEFEEEQVAAFADALMDQSSLHAANRAIHFIAIGFAAWLFVAIVVLVYVDIDWVKGLTFGLLAVSILPAIALWMDILGNFLRRFRS
ncbi:MAG: hypothetical protein JNL67_22765 [Planctomycetaceae bacterium]|nr:hypothetical protein [Planctomycetaceae bacterium]